MTKTIEITQGLGPLGHLTFFATMGDAVVGYLELKDPRPGLDGRLVSHIQVHPDHRRQGIATKMWEAAKASGINPVHALDKTEAGEAWASAVGD